MNWSIFKGKTSKSKFKPIHSKNARLEKFENDAPPQYSLKAGTLHRNAV